MICAIPRRHDHAGAGPAGKMQQDSVQGRAFTTAEIRVLRQLRQLAELLMQLPDLQMPQTSRYGDDRVLLEWMQQYLGQNALLCDGVVRGWIFSVDLVGSHADNSMRVVDNDLRVHQGYGEKHFCNEAAQICKWF